MILGQKSRRQRHIAANAVAGQSQPAAVHTYLTAVFGHPFHGNVNLLDGLRKPRFGRRRIVDENRRATRLRDQIAHQPAVGRIIAQHPAAAVDEDEHRQPFPAGSLRPHKIQAQGAPLALDGPFGLFDARQIYRNGRLQIGQHAARVGHGQRLDGGSAAVQHIQIGLGSLRQVFVVQVIGSFLYSIHNRSFLKFPDPLQRYCHNRKSGPEKIRTASSISADSRYCAMAWR